MNDEWHRIGFIVFIHDLYICLSINVDAEMHFQHIFCVSFYFKITSFIILQINTHSVGTFCVSLHFLKRCCQYAFDVHTISILVVMPRSLSNFILMYGNTICVQFNIFFLFYKFTWFSAHFMKCFFATTKKPSSFSLKFFQP